MFCYNTEVLEGEVAFFFFFLVYFEVCLVKYWNAPSHNQEKATKHASYFIWVFRSECD